MPSQGPSLPTIGENVFWTGSAWSNPGRITSADGSFASALIVDQDGSDFLVGRSLGFNVPTGATIEGFEVGYYALTTSSTSISAYLTKNGGSTLSTDGIALSDSGASWVTVGSPTNLWGETWTVSDVNSTNFGAVVQSYNTSGLTQTCSLDALRITVYYADPVQKAYPDADLDAGTWTTTPLWSKLDEADMPNDTDFITGVAS